MSIIFNEIFYSIQGEGPSAGKPSVFLRLGACNLRCIWCDSK
ncbi:MAG: 7-carboxy-7-deazaguanine synthase, partial [Candidatus Peregrinibacteria bacterium]